MDDVRKLDNRRSSCGRGEKFAVCKGVVLFLLMTLPGPTPLRPTPVSEAPALLVGNGGMISFRLVGGRSRNVLTEALLYCRCL
jgi:hypothetical protein